MSITIPTLTITTGACGSGLPPTIAPFTGLVATTVSLREVTTINAALVEYIVIAAFPTAEINFLTTEIGPECSTVNTFTFSTAGPLSFIESLQALLPAASTTSPFPGVAPPIPTAAFTTSHAATPTTPPPKSIISSGAAAGLAVGCLLAGALLALLGAFLLFKRRQRRAPAAAGPRGYVDAADESEIRRRPVPQPAANPPTRPVGLDGEPAAVRGEGGGVGNVAVGAVEDMPEMRER